LLAIPTLAILNNQPVEAQPAAEQPTVAIPSGVTPEVTAETIARLSFRPRIVGIGQPIIVNIWLQSVVLRAPYKYLD